MMSPLLASSLCLLLLGASLALAQVPWMGVPVVQMGRPLNIGLTDWWLVVPQVQGGLAPLRNLVNPARQGTLTAMTAVGSTTSGYQKLTTRPGGEGDLALDGTGDLVALTNGPTTGLSTFTLSVWFTTTGVTDTDFFAKGGTGGGQYAWAFGTLNDGSMHMTTFDCPGNLRSTAFGGGPFNDGRWHQALVVYQDGVRAEIFVDGVSVAVTTTFQAVTYCVNSTSVAQLGMRSDAANPFTGRLDDARIWKRAVSASMVRALYTDAKAGYPDTLVRLGTSLAPAVAAAAPRRPRGSIY